MNVTKEQEQAILNQARMAQAQAMEQAISKMTDRCFQICSGKKGDGLDSGEVNCTVNCMDRYLDTMQLVSQALANKQQQQH
eukprot:gene1945-2123_t